MTAMNNTILSSNLNTIMGSLPDEFPLSLRTWPSSNDSSTSLASRLPRIHTQCGNFRSISEEALEKEISAAEAGASIAKGNEASSDDEEEEEEKPEDAFKELAASRQQMIEQLIAAHQSVSVALDFTSLMLSRFIPNSASSISAWRKEPGERHIPIGTLGAEMTQGLRHTDAQKRDNKSVAIGWKIMSIDKSVDSILDAATRLEQEMAAEAKYWEDILSIKEKNWTISYATQTSQNERLNTKKSDGTLVVRFGFSESAPEFRNRGLAILRRTDDGSITLENDVLLTKPKGLQVRIEKKGIETGHSSFSLFKDLDTSLESQILRARNVIFEQELWHELLRESRNLVSYGVVVQASSISIPLSSTKRIIIKFATDAEEPSSPFSPNEDSKLANGISVVIHLLLSYSHRQRQRQRSQPPPPISAENKFGNPSTQACTLIRPLISHLLHQAAIVSIHSFLLPLTKVLNSAGLSSTYKIIQKPYMAPPNQGDKYFYLPRSISEKIIESLIDNIGGEAIFHIKDIGGDKKKRTFTIQFRTFMGSIITTHYRVLGASEGYRAPPLFHSFSEVKEYLLFATSCAVAELFTKTSKPEAQAEQESPEGQEKHMASNQPVAKKHDFQITTVANIIHKSIPETNEFREISFRFGMMDSIPVSARTLQKSAKTSLYPLDDDNMRLSLRVERKYKYTHDGYTEESANRRRGGLSVWWIGGGEPRSLREAVEGITSTGLPARWTS